MSREPESLDEQALNDGWNVPDSRRKLEEMVLERLREIHPPEYQHPEDMEVFEEYDRMTDENL